MIFSWEQSLSWLVLTAVLVVIVFAKKNHEVAAFSGIMLLGLIHVAPTGVVFSGFANPALFTVIFMMLISRGIVESGILTGLGKSIARKAGTPDRQVLAVGLVTGALSSFMNNVGAIGIILPTARRMAARAGMDKGDIALPLAQASIIGGSMTLIGTASNILVSTFRYQAFGKPFNMFDFTIHGLFIFASALCWWIIGMRRMRAKMIPRNLEEHDEPGISEPLPRDKKKTVIVLSFFLPAIIFTAVGLVHPAIAFGWVVLGFLFTSLLEPEQIYRGVQLNIIIFIASMLGMAAILQDTGSLSAVLKYIIPVAQGLHPFLLIVAVVVITGFFANILDNSVAVVLMAPTVIGLYRSGMLEMNPDALLMAVAAGASLAVVLPTHQAAIVTMHELGFSKNKFIFQGLRIFMTAVLAASLAIYAVWT